MEAAVFIPTTSLSCTIYTAGGSVRNTTVLEGYGNFPFCLYGNLDAVLGPDISVNLYSRVYKAVGHLC